MIDYWCNAFTPDREPLWQRVIAADGLTIKLGARERDDFAEPSGMVARMNKAGIATLVMPVCDLDADAPLDDYAHYALRPAEIRSLSADHPGRFFGMFSVNPDDPGDVVAAAAALDTDWCVGLHNHTHSWEHRLDAEVFDPYYELAATHAVPFVMQAGRSGGHRIHELGHPRSIDAPARAFPGVQFVLSHLGIPWLTETIEMATTHANVHIGTATHPPRRWTEEFLEFLHGDGEHKVLFGTGYPLNGHLHVLAQLDALDVSAATKEALRQGNARRIFTRIPARVGD
ncbi:MAG: amidohydrolase family protein [Acidimicrobiales bacterium]